MTTLIFLKKWWDRPPYNTSHIIGMVKWIPSGQIKRGYNLKRVTKAEGSYDFVKEITIEQFIKHVLSQEVMEDKEIIGWKLKEDCKQYEQAALKIINSSGFYNFTERYNFETNSYNESYFKKAGVLELWFTPVYKEKTLQFGGYDVIFEKVTSGVRITCNGETGTLSQIEAIYNIVLKKEKMIFGSQEVKQISYSDNTYWSSESLKAKPASIKIGCTAGTWEEFTAIYEKAKSMLQ